MVPPHPHAPLRLSCSLLGCALLGVLAPCARAMSVLGQELTAGGNLALTSDYIYRGVSESNDHAAVQGDVHLGVGGTFGGLWASTRDRSLDPGGSYDFELYLGHRFDLSNTWNLTLSARSHDYAEGRLEPSADYQELAGTLTYLDRWSLSLTVIPNAVRYWFYRRLSRAVAWDADTSGQWAIAGGLFATAGAGYYRSLGTGPGIARATGYAYGDLGLAYEWRRWRIDAGYFLVQNAAIRSSPYPVDNRHFAATLSWRF